MSGLAPLRGHQAVKQKLAEARRRDGLPAALLIMGPPGVGKQRLGLWLAQLLLCENPDTSEPCGRCGPCRLVLRLEHPDLHWFFPLARPKGVSADRLGDALEDARAAELQTRRDDPWYAPNTSEIQGIFLAHAQVIRRLAISRPSMGSRKVFLVGDADLLVSQEASPEAANALLKLLEEPPSSTTIIATTANPDALLPTVRSRLQPVRLSPLPLADVAAVVQEVRGLDPERAALIARLAEGSIGRALGFVGADGEPGPLEQARQHAREIIEAAADPRPARRFGLALSQPPVSARGEYAVRLEFAVIWLRDLAAMAAGAADAIVNIDARDWLAAMARSLPTPEAPALAIADVEESLGLTQFNINPQIGLHALTRAIGRRLASGAGLAATARTS
jgi:DNA polymerase-3 subunit delta'